LKRGEKKIGESSHSAAAGEQAAFGSGIGFVWKFRYSGEQVMQHFPMFEGPISRAHTELAVQGHWRYDIQHGG